MREITFTDPHRRKHFDFFRRMDQPHFSICAPVDITNLVAGLRRHQMRFTPAVVYLLASVANELPPFRQRLRGDKVIEHERIHPSFTVQTQASDVFSFCTVEFQPDAQTFMQAAADRIARMQTDPSLEDEADRDDYLFLSAIPWVSFTGISHAMHYSPVDSVPRITWGKYYQQNDRTLMPLSLQAHHALVNGSDMGRYFHRFAEAARLFAENWSDW